MTEIETEHEKQQLKERMERVRKSIAEEFGMNKDATWKVISEKILSQGRGELTSNITVCVAKNLGIDPVALFWQEILKQLENFQIPID